MIGERLVIDWDKLWGDARAFLEERRDDPEWFRYFEKPGGKGRIIGVGSFHPF